MLTVSGTGELSNISWLDDTEKTSVKTINISDASFGVDVSGMSALEEITFSGTGTFSSAFGASNTNLKTIDLQGGSFTSDISSLNNLEITVGADATFNATVGTNHENLTINVPLATFNKVLEGTETGKLTECKSYLVASGDFTGDYPSFQYKYTINDAANKNVTLTIIGKDNMPNTIVGDVVEGKKPTSVTYPWPEVSGNITQVVVSAGVSEIGTQAFSCLDKMTSITLPSTITKIHSWAFEYCTSLSGIALPTGLTDLGREVFAGCTALKSIDFSGCTGLTKLGDVKINQSDTNENGVFYGCTALETVNLSGCANLTTIGDSTFKGCTNLKTLNMSGCTSLNNITIPNNVKTIGANAFSGCTSLTSITIPDSVKTIGANAFSGCGDSLAVNVAAADKAIVVGGKAFGTGDTVDIASAVKTNEEEVTIGSLALNTEEITYLDPNATGGKSSVEKAIVLAKGVSELAAGTYYVNDTVSLTKDLKLNGDVKIILGSNANLSAPGQISGGTLSVYSAESGGGKFSFDDITGTFNYYGGNVDAWKISGSKLVKK